MKKRGAMKIGNAILWIYLCNAQKMKRSKKWKKKLKTV